MATITGSQGASATPATQLMGNGAGTGVIDTELLAQGWEFMFELPVGKAGSAGPVQVWVPPLEKVGDVSVDPGTRTTLGTLNVACKATAIGANGTALGSGGTSCTVVESATPPATPFYAHFQVPFQQEIVLVTNRVLVSGSTYTYTMTRNQQGTGNNTLSFGASSATVYAVDFTAIVDETATPPATPFWIEVTSATGYTEAMLVTSRVVVAGSQYTYTLSRAVRNPLTSTTPVNSGHRWGEGFLEGDSGHHTAFQQMSAGASVYLVDNVMQVTELPNSQPKTMPFNAKVGSEWVRVGVKSDGTAAGDKKYLMRRGFKGSTPAAHSVGADVYAPPFYLLLRRDDTNARILGMLALDVSDSGRLLGEITNAFAPNTSNPIQAIDNMNLGSREAGAYTSRVQAGGTGSSLGLELVRRPNANTSAAGFNYVLKVTANVFTLATRSAGVNSYIIGGRGASAADMTAEPPLFLSWHPTNAVETTETATQNFGCTQVLQEYAAAAVGTFHYVIAPPFLPKIGGSATIGTSDHLGPAINGGSHKFLTQARAFPAYLCGVVGTTNGMQWRAGTGARGYLPDVVAVAFSTEPTVGDTLTIGGVTYYFLGATIGSVSTRVPKFAIAVKA